jgi:chromosome segregation ATPase
VKQLAVKDNEIEDAKSALENAEKQHLELKDSVPRLKVEIWNMKQRISELETSNANLKESLIEGQVACNKYRAELAKIKSWNAELDAEKMRLELVLKGHKQEISGDQGYTSESAVHAPGKVADFQEEIDCLNELNEMKQTQINELSAELATKQNSVDALVHQLASKSRECAQHAEDMMVYRELTSQDRYDHITPTVESKLKAAGLHKDFPTKGYVSRPYLDRAHKHKNNVPSDITKSAIISPRDLEPIFWEDDI